MIDINLNSLGTLEIILDGENSTSMNVHVGEPLTLSVGFSSLGTKGDKGDQGIQGIQGVAGDKGDQGIQGLKGDQGVRGERGLQGEQGIQGVRGERGIQGEQGIIGFGVSAGGSNGQALVKASDDDYDTTWASINSAAWGNITGTLSSQTDLQGALNGKLSLTGGTMSDNATIVFNKSTLDPDYGDTSSTLSLGYNSLTFNQNTTEIQQLFSISPSGIYGGYDFGNYVFNFDSVGIYGHNDNENGGWSLNTNSVSGSDWSFGSFGIRFYDGSTQASAFIPSDYLTASSINSTYLSQSSAASIYQTQSGMSAYATTSSLTAYAYPLGSNPSGYLTSSSLAPYLTTTQIASGYYPLNSNPSGYLTSSALTGYATQSYVTSQGYITSSALTPYLTTASASSTYQTLSGMSSYATQSYVGSQGFITTSSLTPYATTSSVTAYAYPLNSNPSGYLTSSALTPYLTTSSANSNYYPLNSNPSGYLTSASLSGYAPLSSPAFTGTPTAPTQLSTDSSTAIATTAYVTSAITSATTSGSTQTVIATVRNATGSSIPAASVVYILSANGTHPTIGLAQANAEATSYRTYGITQSSIANSADGTVVLLGDINGLNTQAFADGDQLYLSPTVAGGITNVKPSAPNHMVYVGVCTRGNSPNNGVITVRIQNGYEIEELHNVAISNVANNDSLFYNSTTKDWENKTFSSARTALGLGSMAVETASNYLTISSASSTYLSQTDASNTYTFKSNNLSDLTSASIARTNLGLGTASTNPSTAFLQTANNLSDVTASTARTNLGLAYATDAQVIAGTSASTVITPSLNSNGLLNWTVCGTSFLTSAVSTGTVVNGAYGSRCSLTATTAGQYAIVYPSNGSISTFTTSGSIYGDCNFSKRIKIYGRIYVNPQANLNCYYAWGRSNNTASTIGSPATKGFGIRIQGTGAVELQVHNGTTLSNVTSSFTPTSNTLFDCLIDSLGDGNVNLYINGSLVATSAGGATGSNSGYPLLIQEISSTASSSAGSFYVTGKAIYMA